MKINLKPETTKRYSTCPKIGGGINYNTQKTPEINILQIFLSFKRSNILAFEHILMEKDFS